MTVNNTCIKLLYTIVIGSDVYYICYALHSFNVYLRWIWNTYAWYVFDEAIVKFHHHHYCVFDWSM